MHTKAYSLIHDSRASGLDEADAILEVFRHAGENGSARRFDPRRLFESCYPYLASEGGIRAHGSYTQHTRLPGSAAHHPFA